MGIVLPQSINIRICSKQMSYYKDLGYEIPMKKSSPTTKKRYNKEYVCDQKKEILVNVLDLPKNSTYNIEVECDNCHENFYTTVNRYTTNNKNGLIYCFHCSHSSLKIKENHWHWDKNKTQEERDIARNTLEYSLFIEKVIYRDKNTCKVCGKKSCKKNVHHLNSYNWCIEGRTDVNNGITLCEECHKSFHQIYGRGNNTIYQFLEFVDKNSINEILQSNNEIDINVPKIYCYEDKYYYTISEFVYKYNINKNSLSHLYNVLNHKKYKHNKNSKTASIAKMICGKHIFWADEYDNMDKDEIQKYLYSNKGLLKTPILCLTTGKRYFHISDLKDTGSRYDSIIKCCNNKQKKTIFNNVFYYWIYEKEYISLPIENKINLLNTYKESFEEGSFLMQQYNELIKNKIA